MSRVRPDGTIQAAGLRPGRYRVEVRKDGPDLEASIPLAGAEVEVREGATAEVALEVQ